MNLKGSPQKLFCVLVYLKENPIQFYQASLFSMRQGRLWPCLRRSLALQWGQLMSCLGTKPELKQEFYLNNYLNTLPNTPP